MKSAASAEVRNRSLWKWIDPWLARHGSRCSFWGFAFHGSALADEPASIPPATPQQVQQTVERAIGYLQTESAAWLNTRKCAACHHVPMPLWALSEAERQGYAIDKKFVADTTESLLGSQGQVDGLEDLSQSG